MKRNSKVRSLITSLLLGIFLFTVVMFVFLELLEDEREDLRAATELTAHHVTRHLKWWGEARVESLWQLTLVAPPLHHDDEKQFRATAKQLLTTYPGIQALNWIDANWTIRVINPVEGNEPALGKYLREHPDPNIRETVERVNRTGEMAVTEPAHLYQGGVGMAVYLPAVNSTGNIVGYVNGVIRVDSLVEHAMSEPELDESFNYAVCGPGEQLLYQQGDSLAFTDARLTVQQSIDMFGQEWILTISPSEQFKHLNRTKALSFFIVVSLFISVGAPITLYTLLRRQASLRLNESRYRSLFEGSKDSIYRSTFQGQILNANHAMQDLLGYTRDELAHLNSKFLYANSEEREKLLQELEKHSEVRDYPVLLLQKSGKTLHCLITASHEQDPASGEMVIQGIIRDMTEHVELEEKFHQAQKMEALGRLAGGISHDFNNLLTAILGQVELARFDSKQGEDPMRYIEGIGETAGRASELTRRLLAFSRKQTVKLRPMDLGKAIKDMQSLIKSLIGEDIVLEYKFEEACPQIEADPSQIEQVLINLVVNARDAMPDGGTLTIEVGCPNAQVIGTLAESDFVHLVVRDTGVGMPQEVVSQIFEPYFTTKGETKGTGLGLSTVFGIVEQLGGTIDVQSVVGKGTTFNVVFHRAAISSDEGSELAADEIIEEFRGSESILLVEDDWNVLRTTEGLLKNLGYNVTSAISPVEGLRLLADKKIKVDLLVTDVVMPEMSGAELVDEIRTFNNELPVLYISGHTRDIVLKRTSNEEIHFVQKPFSVIAIAKAIRAAINGDEPV